MNLLMLQSQLKTKELSHLFLTILILTLWCKAWLLRTWNFLLNLSIYFQLNLKKQGTHLWDIRERCLIRKFVCEGQDGFPLNSCFGGCHQNFIASGSEDSMVYIFHKSKETPISVLSGHTRTVNSVAWNPVFHK